MQPGQWAVLETNGFNKGALLVPPGCTVSDSMTQYSDSAAWDPVYKRFLFMGGTHGVCYGKQFLIYNDSDNSWSTGPIPPDPASHMMGHPYDHNTVDPQTGDFYFRQYNSTFIEVYPADGSGWKKLPEVPESVVRLFGTCCNAVEYFPEMGGLVVAGGMGQVGFYNKQTGQWTQLAAGLGFSDHHNIMEYNPVHHVVILSGGTVVYKLDASGKITRMS